MLFLLPYHQTVGIWVRHCLNSCSYLGDPNGHMVLAAILNTGGGPWGLSHAKHRQLGSSFLECTSIGRGQGVFSDLLDPVCNEGVKPARIIVDICLNYLAISPEHLWSRTLYALSISLTLTDTTAAVSSRRGTVIGFNGVTRALPISNEQFTRFLVSTRRR